MKTRMRRAAWFSGVWGLIVSASLVAQAERPTAPHLLPADTVAYVRIGSVPELIEQFGQTAMGRITSDQQVRPFVSDLYNSAAQAFANVEGRVGLPLEDLLAIPQGEVCLAIIAPERARPEVMLLIEAGDHLPDAEKLLASGEAALVAEGGRRSTVTAGDTELAIYDPPGDRQRRIVVFQRDGVICISSNEEQTRQLLERWNGQSSSRTLADDRRFTTIMKRSHTSKEMPPQITFYADPLTLAKRASRGNFSAQAGISIANGLGLDGIKAIGGSAIFASEEFDSVIHVHVMLQNPREGVLKMVAFESGEVTPERWVPDDAASYTTLHWDFEQTYDELVKLYDQFRGEEAWQMEIVGRLHERLGIRLQEDVIEALAGRGTMVTWMERPARINSQANLIGFQLKDADQTRKVLEQVAGRLGEQMQAKTYGGVTYYQLPAPGNRRRGNDQPSLRRAPTPCVAILGDYLVATDSVKFLERAIVTKSDPSRSLANELEFKLIANKIDRQRGETNAGMISFNRPEEGFRLMYELAIAGETRNRLESQAENNGLFRALHSALANNPLPPFAVLARYLAPGGALITDDETGIHYTAFALKRD